jgi:c-di-GMP-binding flagellar brake protein YcgR
VDLKSNERREFFRVHDTLIVEYRIIAQSMIERPIGLQLFKSSSLPHFLRELEELAGACEANITGLGERDPEVALLLSNMNRRLEILTEMVVEGKEEEAYFESRAVTLSEGGMSFQNAVELPEGTFLALKLIFLPSYQTLRLFSRVAQCNLADDDDVQPHSIGVEFVRLTGSDRATLARYVLQKQLESRSTFEEPLP